MRARSAGHQRRLRHQLLASDVHAIDRQRKENIGVAEDVVVEEVVGVGAKCGDVEIPAGDRNCDSDFYLMIALTVQRQKSFRSRFRERFGLEMPDDSGPQHC